MENRYLTRSVRKESERRGDAVDSERRGDVVDSDRGPQPTSRTPPDAEEQREREHAESVRFVYTSHFPLHTLLCSP